MRIAQELSMAAPARVGLSLAVTLGILLVVAVAARPDMMPMGMGMIHGLIVGFGL